MQIIPAIDLKEGKVVRLLRGEPEKATLYSEDPVAVAKEWDRLGASRLHVVDLDGAFSGKCKNLALVGQIVKSVRIPVEMGGGLREEEVVRQIFSQGVQFAILTTRACEDLAFLQGLIAAYPGRILVSLDSRKGKVCTEGWKKQTELEVGAFLKTLKRFGLQEAIVTDVEKDGMLQGPNVELYRAILSQTKGIRLIASGGVSSIEDLEALKSLEGLGLYGVIVGKALYEKRFTLPEAISVC